MGDMEQWAKYYAKRGLAVFPLLPRDKKPATAHGCKNATTDQATITAWWAQDPNYNIGIATGAASGGLVVIDLDVNQEKGYDGRETLRDWEASNGKLPETWTSITGRGGYHLFYHDSATNSNRTNLYEGVDIRGDGGYIVAPPSLHPNGRRYEWEQAPDEFTLSEVGSIVARFLMGPMGSSMDRAYKTSAEIQEGSRNTELYKLACSMQARGDAPEAIRAAVEATNDGRCMPPLPQGEIDSLLKSASKHESGTAPYKVTSVKGVMVPVKAKSLNATPLSSILEKKPEWFVRGYIPYRQITTLAGDGGSGKTSLWCSIAAAVSIGKSPFFISAGPDTKQQKVLFFSAEDSVQHTLKAKLRKCGADMDNIITIDISDERFLDIKFNSKFLEALVEEHRPGLLIFDPIQAFIPPDMNMGYRNAMRQCLAPLIAMGEKYGVTTIIVVHANKRMGAYGRNRIADSADIWDISRSVLMTGETNEGGIRYMTQEKNNYGQLQSTVLFTIDDGIPAFKGFSDKRDRDFIQEDSYTKKVAPAKDEARAFILDYLRDGEKEVKDLDGMADAMSISKITLARAKAELAKEGLIKRRSIGQGKDKHHFMELSGEASKYFKPSSEMK